MYAGLSIDVNAKNNLEDFTARDLATSCQAFAVKGFGWYHNFLRWKMTATGKYLVFIMISHLIFIDD